nr:PREDICTED: uncharacterized protein LOC102349802 [Latimeria chalumnae]|eukprot:XP_014340721.1 PREDICTED: uncharacterized protein LOC102349802 [Latimeria chalumnae]
MDAVESQLPKRRRTEEEGCEINLEGEKCKFRIKISNSFVRTTGDVILQFAKPAACLYLLNVLKDVIPEEKLVEVGQHFMLKLLNIKTGSIIAEYEAPLLSDNKIQALVKDFQTKLQKVLLVEQIQVERIGDDTRHTVEPVVRKTDLAQYVLNSVYSELQDKASCISHDKYDWFNLKGAEEMMSRIIEDAQNCTKISLLSQNGKGKSYILNVLLLLTADTEKDYVENNKKLLYPKDGDKITLKEVDKLPEVIKEAFEFLIEEELKCPEEKFQEVLKNTSYISEDLKMKMGEKKEEEEKSFKALKRYCEGRRLTEFEPYLLPEKGEVDCHLSTTNCTVQLRHGSLYQMKVEYFSKKELQEQLYELFDPKEGSDADEKRKEALKKRFSVLTGKNLEDAFQTIKKPESILFCETVENFAGTTQYYLGTGNDLMEDRIFIREKLQEHATSVNASDSKRKVQEMKRAAVKSIMVYVPSEILEGGKEIHEMPGIDESDPLALFQIQEVLNENKKMQFEKDDDLQKCAFVQQEPERIKADIDGLTQLLKLQTPVSQDVKDRLSHIFALPTFHASLLMQEGDSMNVMRKSENNLLCTGVQKLMDDLDQCGFVNLKSSLEDTRKLLSDLQDWTKECEQFYQKLFKEIKHIFKSREVKQLNMSKFTSTHEEVLIKTNKKLKEARKQFLEKMINPWLKACAEKAESEWESQKGQVDRLGPFNPYFNGRHPSYKVKLFKIAFGELEAPNFKTLVYETRKIMEEYKEDIINVWTTLLLDLPFESDIDKKEIEPIIMRIVEADLSEASDW